jgi:hypothetical protein
VLLLKGEHNELEENRGGLYEVIERLARDELTTLLKKVTLSTSGSRGSSQCWSECSKRDSTSSCQSRIQFD